MSSRARGPGEYLRRRVAAEKTKTATLTGTNAHSASTGATTANGASAIGTPSLLDVLAFIRRYRRVVVAGLRGNSLASRSSRVRAGSYFSDQK